MHVAAPSPARFPEMQQSVLPLDVGVDVAIAKRIVSTLYPDLEFFPAAKESAFRKAQQQDEENEL